MKVKIYGAKNLNTKKSNLNKFPVKDTNNIYITIGENIKQYRKLMGLTAKELADYAGINQSYLGNIERGERKPTLYVLQKIAHILNIKTMELFYKENINKSKKEILINDIIAALRIKPYYEQKKIYSIIKQL